MAQRHGGKVIEESMNSEILKREKNYCVYLPKSYDKETDRSYPVLYLLHGLTNNYKSWRDLGDIGPIANQIINAGNANEMIIIMPDAGTDYDGYFNWGDKWRYEDFFFTEFMPTVEKKYRIKADKEHRAIAGMSIGAMQAMHISANAPSTFGYVGLFSSMVHPVLRRSEHSSFYKGLKGKLATQFATPPLLYSIMIGKTDFYYPRMMMYANYLSSKGYSHEIHLTKGGHQWFNWEEFANLFMQQLWW
jgi:enterochelin esterase-like enzyme